ncbi:Putative UPF0481 protein At3g02645 [Linum perenne]
MERAADSSVILKSAAMEKEWVKHIEKVMHLDLGQLVPSIFQVPESVKKHNPEAYTPQLVGLGIFHHFKPQFLEMNKIKLRSNEQGLRRFNFRAGIDFRRFTNQVVTPLVPEIRAHYDDTLLDISDPTLASIIAMDCLFLVELVLAGSGVNNCGGRKNLEYLKNVNPVVMKDILMLENQIPLFLIINQIRDFNCRPFYRMVGWIFQEMSPLKFSSMLHQQQQHDDEDGIVMFNNPPRHLLEYLYLLIVGETARESSTRSVFSGSNKYSSVLPIMESLPLGLFKHWEKEIDLATATDTLKNAGRTLAVPWVKKALAWLEKLGLMKIVDEFLQREKALIPTASELIQVVGVKILCSTAHGGRGGGLEDMISFDKQERTLRLPVFRWTPNCEVMIRNLVAYESMANGAGILTTYIQLMQGLTATVKDAKLLRERGVIEGNDMEIVKLFSGISTSTSTSTSTSSYIATDRMRATVLHSDMEDLNRCYNNRPSCVSNRTKMRVRLGLEFLLLLAAAGVTLSPAIVQLSTMISFNLGDCVTMK